jgi:PST family polysaccharide transporter
VYFGLQFFGLVGTGVAFFTLYIFYTIMMFILLNRENNFRWTNQVVKIILGMSLLFSLAFVILQFFVQLWGSIIVSFLGVGLSYLAYLEIAKILEVKSFKQLVDLIKNRKK